MTSASAASRSSSGAVTPNEQPARRWTSTGVPVKVIAGCSASGSAPARSAGWRTPAPKRPEVCTSSWPGRTAPVCASPDTRLGQRVVGHGQQHQLGAGQHLGRVHEGDVGEQFGGAAPRGVRDAGGRDGAVPGQPQGRGQRGSDPAGADDADGEPRGAVLGPRGARGVGGGRPGRSRIRSRTGRARAETGPARPPERGGVRSRSGLPYAFRSAHWCRYRT